MDRILRNTTATLRVTLTVDGVPTDPTPQTVTVDVFRPDGSLVVSGSAVRISAGLYSYTLAPAYTAQYEQLTVVWYSTFGNATTHVEVVGGYLFSIAQARALRPLQDTTAYPTTAIVDARTYAETALEAACGVSFVPRYGTATVDGSGGRGLWGLPPRITKIRSVSVGGVAHTAGQLAALALRPTGLLYSPTAWTSGYGNYTVGFEHGYPYAPPRITRAALLLARQQLVASPVDDRTSRVVQDGGTIDYLTSQGAGFDIPEVNAAVAAYNHQPVAA